MREQTRTALEASAHSLTHAYGVRPQLLKACEEMGELTVEICKWLNFENGTQTDAQVTRMIDEIADVFIMVTQLRVIFGEQAVDERIIVKLKDAMKHVREGMKMSVDKMFEEGGL